MFKKTLNKKKINNNNSKFSTINLNKKKYEYILNQKQFEKFLKKKNNKIYKQLSISKIVTLYLQQFINN